MLLPYIILKLINFPFSYQKKNNNKNRIYQRKYSFDKFKIYHFFLWRELLKFQRNKAGFKPLGLTFKVWAFNAIVEEFYHIIKLFVKPTIILNFSLWVFNKYIYPSSAYF